MYCNKCEKYVKHLVVTWNKYHAYKGIVDPNSFCWDCAFFALKSGETIARKEMQKAVADSNASI